MTISTKQRLVIAFSCVLVGCAVGATMPRLAAQSFPPNPAAPRWVQFCETVTGVSAINPNLALRGVGGFELVSVTREGGGVRGDFLVCFKRADAR